MEKGSDGVYEKTERVWRLKIGSLQKIRCVWILPPLQFSESEGYRVDATILVNVETDWAGQETYLIGWGSPLDPDDHNSSVFGQTRLTTVATPIPRWTSWLQCPRNRQ